MRRRDVTWTALAPALGFAANTVRSRLTRNGPPPAAFRAALLRWIQDTQSRPARNGQDGGGDPPHPNSLPSSAVPLAPGPAPGAEPLPVSEPEPVLEGAALARALKARLHVAHLGRATVAEKIGVDVEVVDALVAGAPVAADEADRVRAFLLE